MADGVWLKIVDAARLLRIKPGSVRRSRTYPKRGPKGEREAFVKRSLGPTCGSPARRCAASTPTSGFAGRSMSKHVLMTLLTALVVSCGPTGSLTPHDALEHHARAAEWAESHGADRLIFRASCPSALPLPGPVYLLDEARICLATDPGGSFVYAYPRTQQSMAAEVMIAHETGHHLLVALDEDHRDEEAAECLAGSYYGAHHSRVASWWAGWIVSHRVAHDFVGPTLARERRRAFMRGVRGGIGACIDGAR